MRFDRGAKAGDGPWGIVLLRLNDAFRCSQEVKVRIDAAGSFEVVRCAVELAELCQEISSYKVQLGFVG
jgi:hypothetical protein